MAAPVDLVASAHQHGLGEPIKIHRGRRRISAVAGTVLAAVAVGSVGTVLVVATAGLALATLLAGAALVLGYVYLLPPAGGRPYLGVGNDGLVAALGGGPVPVRWSQITEVAYAPLPAPTLTLTADGDPLVIALDLFAGSDTIMAVILTHTQPEVYRSARASVDAGDRVTWTPLVLTATGLEHTETSVSVEWEWVEAAALHDDGTLDVELLDEDHTVWAGLRPANAIACAALINDLTVPGRGAGALADMLRTALVEARESDVWTRNVLRTVTAATSLFAVILAIGAVVSLTSDEDAPDAPLPRVLDGYAAVCGGRAFTGAPAYTGPGPHPTLIFDGLSASSDLLDLPVSWRAAAVADAQLVACVRQSVAFLAKQCEYTEMFHGTTQTKVTMAYADFEYTLYEIRTRRQVAVVTVRGADITCDGTIAYRPGTPPPQQLSKLEPGQVRDALSKYIGGE